MSERKRELDYQVKIVSHMEILLIAVLLHDLVVYFKGSAKSSDESADLAENILQSYCYLLPRQDKSGMLLHTGARLIQRARSSKS
jgi:hypothetical protein